MPNKFEPLKFNSDMNKIRPSLSPELQSVVDKIRDQVVDLNSDLKDSKAELIKKNSELKKKNANIIKLTKDLQAKTKEYDDALKQNEVLKTERDNLATESSKLKRSRNALVAEVGKKNGEIEQLNSSLRAKTKECDDASNSIRAYKAEVAKLTSEYTKIKELYDGIKAQRQRPIATPTQLSAAFREAMEAMRREVATLEDSPVDYVVSKFDISLKTGIGTDEEGKVSFQLPKEEEIANPENLSTIQFSIKSVPKVRK